MDPIIKVVVGLETHFIVIPHIQSITISAQDNPQVIINIPGKTVVIPVYDLAALKDARNSVEEKYEKDCQTYEKYRQENIKNINDIVQSALEPHLDVEKFRPQKSLLPYRGAKMEVFRKFSSFVFNCLNYFWANSGEDGKKQINSLSIPTVTDVDHNIEHIFVSLMKDLNGFEVYKLFSKDFILPMLLKSYEACRPVTKPIQGSYKLDPIKCQETAVAFVDGLNNQIRGYYAVQK